MIIKMRPNHYRIMDHLSKYQLDTAKNIGEKTHIGRYKIYFYLQELIQHGYVGKSVNEEKGGYYYFKI